MVGFAIRDGLIWVGRDWGVERQLRKLDTRNKEGSNFLVGDGLAYAPIATAGLVLVVGR